MLVTELVTYSIRISNTGETALVSIPLTDIYDRPYLTFVRAVPPPDAVDPGAPGSTGQLIWDNLTSVSGALLPGEAISVQVILRANQRTPADTLAVNRAIADATDENEILVTDSDRVEVGIDDSPTSITLLRFTAVPHSQGVFLRWVTGVEVDTQGFHLWRSGDGTRDNAVRITADLIPATGGVAGATYTLIDSSVVMDHTYTYWLQSVDRDTSLHEYGPLTITLEARPSQGNVLFLPLIQS